MDPHSRLSQFNQRPPKAGPAVQNQRQMDLPLHPKSSPSLDGFAKRSPRTRQSHPRSRKLSSSSSQPPTTPLDGGELSRPIATNARIKRGERLRKDMYLAFVNNALEQKTLVRKSPILLPFTSFIPESLLSYIGK
jgi:RNA polymerase I-specific transcription initiation factor RRN3